MSEPTTPGTSRAAEFQPMAVGDVPELVELLHACFRQIGAERFRTFDPATAERTLRTLAANARARVMVFRRGRILGAFAISCVPSITDADHEQAVEVFCHADPALPVARRARVFARLVRRMMAVARELGARTLHFGVTHCAVCAGVGRHLERQGFTATETIYIGRTYGT